MPDRRHYPVISNLLIGLREGLEAMLDKADIAKFFVWEDAPFFSQRENQLVPFCQEDTFR